MQPAGDRTRSALRPPDRSASVAWVVDVDRVLLASPRGFCAGVEMAIKALAWMTRVFEPPGVLLPRDRPQPGGGGALPADGRGVRRRRRRGARGRAADAVGPRFAARGGRGGPGPGRGGRQRRVPAGQEGPPRGQGPGRQGLHASCTSATRATRRRSARPRSPPTPCTGSSASTELEALPDPDGPVAFLAQTTLAVDEWQALLEAARDRWPDLWVPGHLGPVLRHHQPPDRPQGHRRPLRRGGRDRLGQLVEHPGPGAHRRRPPAARGCCGSTGRRAARRPAGHGRRHRRRVGARGAGAGGGGPAGAPRTASRRSGRSTRTSTSRCPGSCATPSGTWRRPPPWPAWPPAAIPPPAGHPCPMTASCRPPWPWPA